MDTILVAGATGANGRRAPRVFPATTLRVSSAERSAGRSPARLIQKPAPHTLSAAER